MDKRHSLFALAIIALSPQVASSQECNINPEKRAKITAVLCGAQSLEVPYRSAGPSCASRSMRLRMADTAKQIVGFRLCGDHDFADKLHSTTVVGMALMQRFVSCTGENFHIVQILEDELSAALQASAGWKCDAGFLALLANRKPAIDAEAERGSDPQTFLAILDKFQINLQPDGSITDR